MESRRRQKQSVYYSGKGAIFPPARPDPLFMTDLAIKSVLGWSTVVIFHMLAP